MRPLTLEMMERFIDEEIKRIGTRERHVHLVCFCGKASPRGTCITCKYLQLLEADK
jgi:hypothetical protein